MVLKRCAIFLSLFLLAACGTTMKVDDFKSLSPELKLEDYFSGSSKAWGVFEDRFGNIRTQFVVDIEGKWDGKTLILEENFRYADGDTEFRKWIIEKTAENQYEGTTENVIGVAKGEVAGNAFNWRYDFNLDVGDGDIWKVRFDDWMFLQPDGVLLNKATVTRWGFKIGTVFISFTKEPQKMAKLVTHSDPANEDDNVREVDPVKTKRSVKQ
jgi:hypothetical protein